MSFFLLYYNNTTFFITFYDNSTFSYNLTEPSRSNTRPRVLSKSVKKVNCIQKYCSSKKYMNINRSMVTVAVYRWSPSSTALRHRWLLLVALRSWWWWSVAPHCHWWSVTLCRR